MKSGAVSSIKGCNQRSAIISGLDGENIHNARDAIDGFCNTFGLLTVLHRWYRSRVTRPFVDVHASEGNQAHVGREFTLTAVVIDASKSFSALSAACFAWCRLGRVAFRCTRLPATWKIPLSRRSRFHGKPWCSGLIVLTWVIRHCDKQMHVSARNWYRIPVGDEFVRLSGSVFAYAKNLFRFVGI
jgi:hypothetical protein